MRSANDKRDPSGSGLSRRLDLHLLELFECVYRTRNLTAAGVRLGLSQPAVSRGLARLREAYADPLFVRQQRGVQPTPLADRLATPLAAALGMVRDTAEPLTFDASADRRHLRIAMSDIGERFFLPRLQERLAKAAPGVTLEAVSQTMPELAAGLASGEINLVAGFLPDLGKQVHQRRLFRERFIYIVRTGHPAVRKTLTREQLRELPHVLACPPGTPHAAAVERVLAGPRVRARIALRVRSFLCVAPIVIQTDLIAAVPSNLASLLAEHLDIQILESPVQIPGFDVSLAWHDRFHRDPAIEWLRDVFFDLFRPAATA